MCFTGDKKHLTDIVVQGVEQKGFAFREVLQPAVPYNKWAEYREQVEYLEKEPGTYFEAIKVAKEKHKFTIGVFYRTTRPVYHKELYGDHNPVTNRLSRDERINKIRKILESK